MHAANLCRVGNSVMLAIPPDLLGQLRAQVGTEVSMDIQRGHLVVQPRASKRYQLADLLAASDYSQPQSAEAREWVDAPALGAEPL